MRETLINNFLRISKIPRESGHEEKIVDFFLNIAKKHSLYYFKDKNNNILIRKKGNISSEPIAFQAHLDMVCIKSDSSSHNFKTDGIDVIIDKDKVTANGTTLGADQGVGLAIMLTIMEDETLNHPDLEFLFTSEEETTFKGSVTFPYEKVKSKRLINLDYSKDDVVIIGSDGDILNQYNFKGSMIENNLPSYKILIDGFPGGNSGDNIDLSKDNAITTMAKKLVNKDIFLKSISGGTFENDLATSCEVIINTNLNVEEIFQGLTAKIKKINSKFSFSKEDTKNILNEILELKCGYISKNSSGNLGMIKTRNNKVDIYHIIRSIDEAELENINIKNKKIKNNFQVSEIYRDPIWKVSKKSDLLNRYKNVYLKEYNEYPKEDIGHGGTECSAINKRIKDLDIISVGANMKNIHTTEETTDISSWIKIFNLLTKLIASL